MSGIFGALARARANYTKGQVAGDQAREASELAEASRLAQMYAQQRAARQADEQLGLSRDRLGFDRQKSADELARANREFDVRTDEARAQREAAASERQTTREFTASQNQLNRELSRENTRARVDASQQPRPARMSPMVVQHMAENRASLQKIDDAIAAIQTDPKAFGLKNYLGDAIMQRADPGGVGPRALVADVGSLVFHDRSGAAVTPSEAERLKPFIPTAKDDAAAALTKLKLLRQRTAMIADDLDDYYGQGPGTAKPGGAVTPPPAFRRQGPPAPTTRAPVDPDAILQRWGLGGVKP